MNKFTTLVPVFAALAAGAFAVEPPTWAYPVVVTRSPTVPAAPDNGQPRHVPDSTAAFTRGQLAAHAATVPDWHPEDHPPLPGIVARGREPAVWACGYCHLPTGAGRPENASLAGLKPDYIKLQIADFRNGDRPGAVPRRAPQQLMVAIAKAATDAEIEQAAAYFASLKPESFVKVIECTTVPETYVTGTILAKVPGGGTEPIGNRIIEVPEELTRFENRDSRTPYIAYVPVGSLAKGAALVTTGGGKTQQCATCHGPDLRGLGYIPPLAGRSPSYLMRQLYDIRSGARKGSSALMIPVVANLTDDDLLAIVAYLASRSP